MPLRIYRIPAGPLETNAYLAVDTVSGDAMLVDAPPGVGPLAARKVEEAGANVRYIVITHGHWDHILGAAEAKNLWPVPIVGHELVRGRLTNTERNLVTPVTPPDPMQAVELDQAIGEGDELAIGGHRFTVFHMPGHDPAHITLYNAVSGVLFGGDVLFQNGHGRTDLPGADQAAMNHTLKRLLELPPETRVLPGHGDETTIGREAEWIRKIP